MPGQPGQSGNDPHISDGNHHGLPQLAQGKNALRQGTFRGEFIQQAWVRVEPRGVNLRHRHSAAEGTIKADVFGAGPDDRQAVNGVDLAEAFDNTHGSPRLRHIIHNANWRMFHSDLHQPCADHSEVRSLNDALKTA